MARWHGRSDHVGRVLIKAPTEGGDFKEEVPYGTLGPVERHV